MKPLATLNRPVLKTVDVETKEETVSFKERTDVTAVPAMGVVAETMVALVLAAEALRKFGGDSIAEFVRNRDGYVASLRLTHLVLVGLMGAGRRPSAAACPTDWAGPSSTPTRWSRRARGARCARSSSTTASPRSASSRPTRCRDALDAPGPTIVAAAGGVVLDRGEPEAARASERHGRVAAGGTPAPRGAGRDGRSPSAARATTPQACWPRWPSIATRCTARSPTSSSTSRASRRTRSPIGCSRRSARVITVRVPLAHAPYDVLVGPGARHELAAVLPDGVRRSRS